MAREYSYTVTLNICGFERNVDVTYEVEQWGSLASWDNPGDPMVIQINSVTDAKFGYDMYDFCNETRDLWTNRFKNVNGPIKLTHGPSRQYSVGGEVYPPYCSIMIHDNKTLLDAIEDAIYADPPELDMDDYLDDYAPSFYHADTRTEHDV